VKRTGNQGAVASHIPHAIQVPAGEDTTPRQEPDAGEATPQRLQQSHVHSTSRTDSTEVQKQQGRDSCPDGLVG
jgi:hypothetical protein